MVLASILAKTDAGDQFRTETAVGNTVNTNLAPTVSEKQAKRKQSEEAERSGHFVNAMDPRFGCRGNGLTNDYRCLHLATIYLESIGGGTLFLPDASTTQSPDFTGRYVCAQIDGAGYHNGCIEVTSGGNIKIEFAPKAWLVMKNLYNGQRDGSYHGIFIGDPTFVHQVHNIDIQSPHITWLPAPARRTQGDGIHIVGSPFRSDATRDVTVSDGLVENAPQVGYGAFGTLNAQLLRFKTINSLGNGSIFSSTWGGSSAQNISCSWTIVNIGDDCVEATAYYNLANPEEPFVYGNGEEPFNSPNHSERNNNGTVIRDVQADGGLADGVRMGGCYDCSAENIYVTGKSNAGVIIDSSVQGSVYLSSTHCSVKNVHAKKNRVNFAIHANGDVKHAGQIQEIGIVSAGRAYSNSPRCEVVRAPEDPDGRGATCHAMASAGTISSISFTPGSGYKKTPEVSISDPTGHGAILQATLSNEFLDFQGDSATGLHLEGGVADNLLVTGGVYGFSLGTVDASEGQVRLNDAQSYELQSLICNCNTGRGIYISGNSAPYRSPIDANTPNHSIVLGTIINNSGPIEIANVRGIDAALLESSNSSDYGVVFDRVIDAKVTAIKVHNANRSDNRSSAAALLVSTSHRIAVSRVEIVQEMHALASLSVGGGSDKDVSEDINLPDIIYKKSEKSRGNDTLVQGGPFAPRRFFWSMLLCSGDIAATWKNGTAGTFRAITPGRQEPCDTTITAK
jgi:hypothetical protein